MKIDPIFVFESENIIENVFQKNCSQKKREDDRRSNRESNLWLSQLPLHTHPIILHQLLCHVYAWITQFHEHREHHQSDDEAHSRFLILFICLLWSLESLFRSSIASQQLSRITQKKERKCSTELSMHAMMICCVLLLSVLKNSAFCHGSSCTHMRGKRDERRMQFKD